MKLPSDNTPIEQLLANTAIVLKHPKSAENIGAAARCAMNMGLSSLVIVRDDEPERENMLKMATHNAAHLIDSMKRYENLADALTPFSFVVGTTARLGRQRRAMITPREMADKLLPFLKNNRVALLFGPEDRGLTNEDLKYCNLITTIPTADFSSLNLAQAVAVHCYELRYGLLHAENKEKKGYSPKLADSFELEGMYEHVEQVLRVIDFLKPEDGDYWIRNIRNFLGRIRLRAREVKIIRGFCRQFLRYDSKTHENRNSS